jgi:hypothetical protein
VLLEDAGLRAALGALAESHHMEATSRPGHRRGPAASIGGSRQSTYSRGANAPLEDGKLNDALATGRGPSIEKAAVGRR